jgi:hypothetical protein
MVADRRNQPAVVTEFGVVSVLDPQWHIRQDGGFIVPLDSIMCSIEDIDIEFAPSVLAQGMNQSFAFKQASFTGSDEDPYG